MTNRIRFVEVRDHSLIPAEAEVRVFVVPEQITPTTEVRGRLMGPTCPFSTTVEVAYHWRPVPRGEQFATTDPVGLLMRAIIPEASLWEPETPFLYHGPVELWQDGRRCDQVGIHHGLRALSLGPRGLRLNGKPLTLRGVEVPSLTEEEAVRLRKAGRNLLVVPIEPGAEQVWELGDRFGFLVLGRVASEAPSRATLAALASHASCLGWLVGPGQTIPDGLPPGTRVGAEVDSEHPQPADGAAFVVGRAEDVQSSRLPILLSGSPETNGPTTFPVLGWLTP